MRQTVSKTVSSTSAASPAFKDSALDFKEREKKNTLASFLDYPIKTI